LLVRPVLPLLLRKRNSAALNGSDPKI
jgi:hypothetical protein